MDRQLSPSQLRLRKAALLADLERATGAPLGARPLDPRPRVERSQTGPLRDRLEEQKNLFLKFKQRFHALEAANAELQNSNEGLRSQIRAKEAKAKQIDLVTDEIGKRLSAVEEKLEQLNIEEQVAKNELARETDLSKALRLDLRVLREMMEDIIMEEPCQDLS